MSRSIVTTIATVRSLRIPLPFGWAIVFCLQRTTLTRHG